MMLTDRWNWGAHVDDVNVLACGRREAVIGHAEGAVVCLKTQFDRAKLDMADKSFVVGSDIGVARELAARLQTKGIVVQALQSGRDLGVDFGGGRLRRFPILQKRLREGARRSGRSKVLHKILKRSRRWRARRLWQVGIAPVMQYGAAQGVCPAQLAKMRNVALEAADAKAPGQCTTATLAILLGPRVDPAMAVPIQTILNWAAIVGGDDKQWEATRLAWRRTRARLQECDYHWGKVTGPMAATQMVLHQAGWEPSEPLCWRDPSGGVWQVRPGAPPSQKAWHQVLQRLRGDIATCLWNKAAMAHLGAGLMGVPDLEPLHRRHKRLLACKAYAAAGLLRKLVGAAMWPPARVTDAMGGGEQRGPECPLCGADRCDEAHVAWQCEEVNGMKQVQELRHDRLRAQALQSMAANPALWLRGLTNAGLDQVPPPLDDWQERLWPEGPWRPGHYFTDGSGGRRGADCRLRRVGYAAVALADTSEWAAPHLPRASVVLVGKLPGDPQTVNRGELSAVVRLLQRVEPEDGTDTIIWSDSKYVVDRARAQGGEECEAGFNDDLWQEFQQQHCRHHGRLQLRKVPAHRTLEQALHSDLHPWLIMGNAMADGLADAIAAEYQVPAHIAARVDEGRDLAASVMDHLMAAWGAYLGELEARGITRGAAVRSARPKPRTVAEKRASAGLGPGLVGMCPLPAAAAQRIDARLAWQVQRRHSGGTAARAAAQ